MVLALLVTLFWGLLQEAPTQSRAFLLNDNTRVYIKNGILYKNLDKCLGGLLPVLDFDVFSNMKMVALDFTGTVCFFDAYCTRIDKCLDLTVAGISAPFLIAASSDNTIFVVDNMCNLWHVDRWSRISMTARIKGNCRKLGWIKVWRSSIIAGADSFLISISGRGQDTLRFSDTIFSAFLTDKTIAISSRKKVFLVNADRLTVVDSISHPLEKAYFIRIGGQWLIIATMDTLIKIRISGVER